MPPDIVGQFDLEQFYAGPEWYILCPITKTNAWGIRAIGKGSHDEIGNR
jgi:hypothetical protein